MKHLKYLAFTAVALALATSVVAAQVGSKATLRPKTVLLNPLLRELRLATRNNKHLHRRQPVG